MSMWGGLFIDKYGSKKVLLASLLLFGKVFLCLFLLFSSLYPIIFNVLLWCCMFFFDTASKAYISESCIEEERPIIFSHRLIAINCGAAIGLFYIAFLNKLQPEMLFLATSFICYIVFFLYLVYTFNYQAIQNKTASLPASMFNLIAKDKSLINFCIIGIILFTAYSQLTSTLPLVLNMPNSNAHQFYAKLLLINTIIIIFIQIPVGIIINKFNIHIFSYIGIALLTLSYLTLASANATNWYLIALFMLSFSEVINSTVNNIIIDKLAPLGMKGIYFGFNGFAMIGLSIGPVLGGFILEKSGKTILYLGVSILVTICFFLYWKCINKISNFTGASC